MKVYRIRVDEEVWLKDDGSDLGTLPPLTITITPAMVKRQVECALSLLAGRDISEGGWLTKGRPK